MTEETPRHILERLEIAILTGETLQLHWAGPDDGPDAGRAWMGRVTPREVTADDRGHHWLEGTCEDETVRIRLDRIRNMPTPVK